jgi:surface protein
MKEYLKKYKLYIIIGVSILILSVGGTLAYYIWSSNTNAIVNTEVCTPTVTFAGGSTINGVDMIPVLTKEEGTIKDIEVKKNSTCNRDVTMNLYLELTTFPTELSDSSFKYELYKNSETTAIASGNFSNKEQGNTITLLSNQILNTSKDTYTLYIYIDGNVDNPSTMAGKNFLFKLWGSGEGAIYKENVITTSDNPTGGTSKFFNTEVMREEIQSLTIAEDNTVPDIEGVVSKDISSNQDGTVMLWYTPKEVTSSDGSTKTMYDMWIGGENGVLQTGTNASGMFAYLTNIEKLDLSKLDTSYITNMSRMFYNSSGLKSIDLSNFNTSNVTSMASMFDGCSNILNLDLSNFDTSKVTSMRRMFSDASSLQTLNISNFNLSNVDSMSEMFKNCTNLINLILPNSSAPKLINIQYAFYKCTNLKGTIDLSNFKPNNYVDFEFAFYYCKNITEVKLNNFKFSSFRCAFYGCTLLEKIDFTGISTSNITDMQNTFSDCSSLTSLDLTNFDVSMVATNKYGSGGLHQTFAGCSSLETLNITGWKITNKVTSLYGTFDKCSKLKKLDLSNWDTSGVTTLNYAFRRMTNIEEIDLRRADFSNVTSTTSVFYLTNNNVKIIVKDDIQKNWFNTNFSNLTNIVVAD